MIEEVTPGWIVCGVTGRSWPADYRMSLRQCVRCKRFIDIRHESWADGPQCDVGPCPAFAADIVVGEVVEQKQKPLVLKTSEWDWPKDEVHAETMERIRREEQDEQAESTAESDGPRTTGSDKGDMLPPPSRRPRPPRREDLSDGI